MLSGRIAAVFAALPWFFSGTAPCVSAGEPQEAAAPAGERAGGARQDQVEAPGDRVTVAPGAPRSSAEVLSCPVVQRQEPV